MPPHTCLGCARARATAAKQPRSGGYARTSHSDCLRQQQHNTHSTHVEEKWGEPCGLGQSRLRMEYAPGVPGVGYASSEENNSLG
eukprot:scaffold63483_cov69-Phaeocystis_antarctica.AAC.2